jgi:hypothetical protein
MASFKMFWGDVPSVDQLTSKKTYYADDLVARFQGHPGKRGWFSERISTSRPGDSQDCENMYPGFWK